MNTLDKQILNIIQQNFPITEYPFKKIADLLNVSETIIIERINSLIEQKIIRRIGGVFSTRKLGFASTLMAMNVPSERIDEVADYISSLDGVSHNYKRDDDKYNLWFTLMASSQPKLDSLITQIKDKTGINDILNLPVVEEIKIHVNFKL